MTKSACRLYLVTPPRFDISTFSETLEEVLNEVDCASVLLDIASDDAGLREEAASELMSVTFSHDRAFLIADAPETVLKLGADGVHLSSDKLGYADARKILGADRIVGINTGYVRHAAMEAGEAGADYVGLGNLHDTAPDIETLCNLTAWWAQLFEVPCVAFANSDLAQAERLIRAGADFLGLRDKIWNAPEGAVKAARNYVQMMQTATAA